MFKVVVTEVNAMSDLGAQASEVKRFEQCVDVLDLRAVISAVNQKPRKPREPKVKK